MAESITISTNPPSLKSEDFALLREEGLRRVEQLAGQLWTNFNLGDPGLTVLEALCYSITDLGYRSSYSIPDLIAQDPALPSTDIKNFFTAREILPMHPVTFKDYRKLLMDVEVYEPEDLDCPRAGVKNAWITKAADNEVPVYLNSLQDKLAYTPVDPADPQKLDIRVLYDVLLEFSTCEVLGDLNENTIEGNLILHACSSTGLPLFDARMSGIQVRVEVEFPRWDADVDWTNEAAVKAAMRNVVIDFERLPAGYKVQEYGFDIDNEFFISITSGPLSNNEVPTGCIEALVNEMISGSTNADNFVLRYMRKIRKIQSIVKEVRKTLMANRNLCEDFFRISALKVEEIAMCADIQVAADADINEIEAKIYFEVANFLSPTVYFRSLEEMYARGYKTEEIFEGPALEHGFIDDAELIKADRRSSIHVSDIISIIMDIPGVVAVKNIQIANIPLDNVTNIPSQSVKWCLQLAIDQNYIPRLAIDRSSITYYKGLLPFSANEVEADIILDKLISEQRPQKLYDTQLDLPVPEGTFRNIRDYKSVQEEFPLTYGIGRAGLPANASDERIAQARQLKGFLMAFDQLLVNYLAQLSEVKDLFSMNRDMNALGEFVINKTYFSESLIPFVPEIGVLLADATTYPQKLQEITESPELFDERRNRFLDHLMARFGEQFTDYALMVYTLSGKKAPDELLIDKLNFLNNYPEISGGRFKAFNYESPCKIWHPDNISGLEERISLLTGIDERNASHLQFPPSFKVIGSGPFSFEIDLGSSLLLHSVFTYNTVEDVKYAFEEVVINGIYAEKYIIIDGSGKVITEDNSNPPFNIVLSCDDKFLAISDDYALFPNLPGSPPSPYEVFVDTAVLFFSDEYYNNPESNRENLTCPMDEYIVVNNVDADMVADPPQYIIDFELYQNPFYLAVPNVKLLDGEYRGNGKCKASAGILAIDPLTYTISLSGDYSTKIFVADDLNIVDSINNDGNYVVQSINVITVSPGVFQTDIVLSGTPVLVAAAPLGTVKYNVMTASEIVQLGLENEESALFEVISAGLSSANYVFTDYQLDPPYRFQILDRCGDVMATSEETDFNDALTAIIANHQDPGATDEIVVIGSSLNNGTYHVTATSAEGANIRVEVAEPIQSLLPDGKFTFAESGLAIVGLDVAKHSIIISGNYARIIFPGQLIEISNSDVLDGNYTVKKTIVSGVNTVIVVNEALELGSLIYGDISYVKEMVIVAIDQATSSDAFIVKGGADDLAMQEMIDFLKEKFFSHEGMHIVEHVLLRPRHNGDFFVKFDEGGQALDDLLSTFGNLTFTKKEEVVSADKTFNTFFVSGDITAELTGLMKINIAGSAGGVNDGQYTVLTFGFNGTDTGVRVLEVIPDDALLPGTFGEFLYSYTVAVDDIPNPTEIEISVDPSVISADFPVTISGSELGINDGSFEVSSISSSPAPAIITVNSRLTAISDRLLDVNIKVDCESCRVEDPYSYIFSVILPSWQGRFANQDFRAFFDRAFRLETPAHLVPSICWVDFRQMKKFEERYKRWLFENSREVKNKLALSIALGELIEVMEELRSDYPQGTLHDCAVDDTLTNAIILNRTVLGTN